MTNQNSASEGDKQFSQQVKKPKPKEEIFGWGDEPKTEEICKWQETQVPLNEQLMVSRSDGQQTSPGCFFVQVEPWFEQIENMMVKPGEKPLSAVAPGMRCVAVYDDVTYRAEIIDVKDDDVTVRFIDFGNVEAKKRNQVYMVDDKMQPQNVLNSGKLSFACRLTDVEAMGDGRDLNGKWSDTACHLLQESLQIGEDYEAIVRAKVAGQNEYPIEIQVRKTDGDESTKVSLSEMFVDRGLAKWITSSTQQNVERDVVKWAESDVRLNEWIEVVRSDGDTTHIDALYFQPVAWFNKIDEVIVEAGENVLDENVGVGDACVATFEDEWFRAVVKEVTSDDVMVQFIDYGNTEWKARDQVFIVDRNIQSKAVLLTDRLAVGCYLSDMRRSSDDLRAVNEQLAQLLPCNVTVQALIRAKVADEKMYPVEIKMPDGRLVSQMLVEWLNGQTDAATSQSNITKNGYDDDDEEGASGGMKKGEGNDGQEGKRMGNEEGERDDGQEGKRMGDEEGESGGMKKGERDDGQEGKRMGDEEGESEGMEDSEGMNGEEGTKLAEFGWTEVELGQGKVDGVVLVGTGEHTTAHTPSMFHVLRLQDDLIQTQLTAALSPPPAHRLLSVARQLPHTPCLALFEDNWCRAEIVRENESGDKVELSFVDFADMQWYSRDAVFELGAEQPRFVRETPRLMIPCRLYGIDHDRPWSPAGQQAFKDLTVSTLENGEEEDKVLSMEFVGKSETGVYSVRLTDKQTNVSLAKALIDAEWAQPEALQLTLPDHLQELHDELDGVDSEEDDVAQVEEEDMAQVLSHALHQLQLHPHTGLASDEGLEQEIEEEQEQAVKEEATRLTTAVIVAESALRSVCEMGMTTKEMDNMAEEDGKRDIVTDEMCRVGEVAEDWGNVAEESVSVAEDCGNVAEESVSVAKDCGSVAEESVSVAEECGNVAEESVSVAEDCGNVAEGSGKKGCVSG